MLTIKSLVLHLQRIQSSASFLSPSRCCFKLGRSQSAFLSFNNLRPLHCLDSFISLETKNSSNGFVWCLSEEVKLNFEWISERAGSTDPLFPEPLFRKYNLRDKLFLWLIARQSFVPSRNCRFLFPQKLLLGCHLENSLREQDDLNIST